MTARLDSDGLACDVVAYPLADPLRLHAVGLRQQDCKCLTAKPADQVTVSQLIFHHLRDIVQQLIAHCLPCGLIDVLKVVYDHHGKSKRSPTLQSTEELNLGLAVPCIGVKKTGLSIYTRLGNHLSGYEITPVQHDRRHGEHHEYRVYGHYEAK